VSTENKNGEYSILDFKFLLYQVLTKSCMDTDHRCCSRDDHKIL